MCCLKIDTDTLLANCLNACKLQSFSSDDLNSIVKKLANTTDRYIFSDVSNVALHNVVAKYPKIFCFASEDKVSLCNIWQRDDEELPMKYFNFGYAKAITDQIDKIARVSCVTE